ncbi:hypothetical protein DFH09DRAFT_1106582 [Mycena vulgaris]|nr:hypothetical protein DFH09DRAFT_1106582 [Mycena vulgaris]
MVDFDPIFPLLPLTVAGVLRWLNLHPHPCKPSQIGASYPPGPSSSPSYRFGNILGTLALAVSRASTVDAPPQRLQARPQLICSPRAFLSRCLLWHGQQNSNNLATGSMSQARTAHGRRRLGPFIKTQTQHDVSRGPEVKSHESATAIVPITLIDAAAAPFTLDACTRPSTYAIDTSGWPPADYDLANHFVLPGSGSQLRLCAAAGAPLLDVLFSIALSM